MDFEDRKKIKIKNLLVYIPYILLVLFESGFFAYYTYYYVYKNTVSILSLLYLIIFIDSLINIFASIVPKIILFFCRSQSNFYQNTAILDVVKIFIKYLKSVKILSPYLYF